MLTDQLFSLLFFCSNFTKPTVQLVSSVHAHALYRLGVNELGVCNYI